MENRVRDLFARANLSEQVISVHRLERGYSNVCFRVVTDLGNSYKVRFAHNNDVIDRENELRVLAHVGVRPLYYGEGGDSVWHWIEGEDLSGVIIGEEIIDGLVNIVEAVHRKGMDGVLNHDDLEYVDLGVEYLSEEVVNLYRNLAMRYAKEPRRLCHNDISLSNLIYDAKKKQLSFIDYEWGRVNNPCWDYGNFVKEADLSEELVELLSRKTRIPMDRLYEFALMASCYSIQLSFVFRDQTIGLEKYRERLNGQIARYRKWLAGR